MWKKDVQRMSNLGEYCDNLKIPVHTMLNLRRKKSKTADPPYSSAGRSAANMSAAMMFAMYRGKWRGFAHVLTRRSGCSVTALPSEFERAKIDTLRRRAGCGTEPVNPAASPGNRGRRFQQNVFMAESSRCLQG